MVRGREQGAHGEVEADTGERDDGGDRRETGDEAAAEFLDALSQTIAEAFSVRYSDWSSSLWFVVLV
jgi:hypothetical protein